MNSLIIINYDFHCGTVLSFSDSFNYYIKDGEHTLLPLNNVYFSFKLYINTIWYTIVIDLPYNHSAHKSTSVTERV